MSISPESPLSRLAWFVRATRQLAGRSQAETAERLAMLLDDYIAVERGRQLPEFRHLILLAGLYGQPLVFWVELGAAAGIGPVAKEVQARKVSA